MAADELGGGVDHDVGSVLNGPDQVGGAKGVVDDQGQTVLVGDLRDGVNVGNIAVGVAQGLQIDGLGVGLDGALHLRQIMGIHKSSGDAELGQRMGQQVEAAAVDGLLGNNVVAGLGQSLDGVCNGRGTGGQGQSRHAALQSRDALFQHILGGVGQAAVDVAGVRQAEPGRRVGGVAEDVGSGLVNGDRTGIGGGVSLFLADVELQSLKFIVTHGKYLFHSFYLFQISGAKKPGHQVLPGKEIRPCDNHFKSHQSE